MCGKTAEGRLTYYNTLVFSEKHKEELIGLITFFEPSSSHLTDLFCKQTFDYFDAMEIGYTVKKPFCGEEVLLAKPWHLEQNMFSISRSAKSFWDCPML